jgi:hypothetical protein
MAQPSVRVNSRRYDTPSTFSIIALIMQALLAGIQAVSTNLPEKENKRP